MSATNVSGDVGATSSTGASARSEDVGPFAARSGQSVEQQPRHSSDGTMSFADHLLHSENQGSGSSRAQVTEDDAGDEEDVTVDAPMLSSGLATCSYVELAPESVPANSGGRECEKKADINHDVNSLDCANLVDASSNVDGTTRPGGPQTAAVQIPETTTGNTDTATSGLPALADEANAADCLVSGDESRPSTRQQSSPTTTAVPELPVSQLQNQSTTSFSTVPPVPPKIPEQEITTEIKQEKAGSRGSIQSSITVPHLSATEQEDQTNQQHQQQQQTRTPVRPAVIKEDAKELKDKSSYILSSFKKLRRSNSRREITKSTKLAPEEARPTLISPQQSTASSHSLSTANAGPQMTSDQWQETQHAAAFPTHTGTQVLHSWETVLPPPPPPIQLSSDQDWSEDGLGVPASLRPGRDVSVERYEYQFAQHQSQYQRREQHQSSHAYAPYIHHSPKEAPQRAPLHQYSHQEAAHEQHSQRIPCDECQEHFEEAWAQSESHRHALTRQLAAAREQSARQIALLHDRDAEFADLSSLVERLRTRIQEQVRQLEQMPAAFTGKNTVSGLAGYAAGGVGLLPDGQIRDRWKNLQWQIRQCVDARLAALPSSTTLGPVRPEQVPFLRRLTPDYGKFLRSRQGSASLVEAAVWTMLADNIFSGARRTSRMCWAAPWSTHLVKMNDHLLHLTPNDPAFHRWRVQTAIYLRSVKEKMDGQQQLSTAASEIDAVVRQLEIEVGFLLGIGTGGSSATVDARRASKLAKSFSSPASLSLSSSSALRCQLHAVVADAINLDADLCQQLPWYYVHYPTTSSGDRYGMSFNSREMENTAAIIDSGNGSDASNECAANARSNSSQHTQDDVSLVIRPALFKAGSSRGEAYDQVFPLEPSTVCLAIPAGHGLRRWAGGFRDRSLSKG